MHLRSEHAEMPPTAGLPLRIGDLLPAHLPTLPETLRDVLGHDDALIACSGTAALVIALTTLARTSTRRTVILPAWTCPLVAIAVAHCGLDVRLCDSRRGHFEMDNDALHQALGRDTLAVVPAHLGGRVADIAGVQAMAHAAGAMVVEDAAQALGARHGDSTPVGLKGDIGVFSLAAGKGLSTYEGGLLLSRHPQLHEDLRHAARSVLRRHSGWELRRSLELLGYAALYRPRGLRLIYGGPLRRALARGDRVGAVGDRFD
ncbi:MAG: aminotransferase class I/II-fold pyridoxal phosphate-dependent enzyme, partial [Rhodanobacteraceae bacterium]